MQRSCRSPLSMKCGLCCMHSLKTLLERTYFARNETQASLTPVHYTITPTQNWSSSLRPHSLLPQCVYLLIPTCQIGFIGLVEKEWLVTLATIELEDLEFTDYVECAKQLLPSLQVHFQTYYR